MEGTVIYKLSGESVESGSHSPDVYFHEKDTALAIIEALCQYKKKRVKWTIERIHVFTHEEALNDLVGIIQKSDRL